MLRVDPRFQELQDSFGYQVIILPSIKNRQYGVGKSFVINMIIDL
ncbi:uncharacterized protein METZ01_LOCUS251767, partial [marine metagenome]